MNTFFPLIKCAHIQKQIPGIWDQTSKWQPKSWPHLFEIINLKLTSMWNTLVKPEIRRIANQQEFKKRVNSELDLSFCSCVCLILDDILLLLHLYVFFWSRMIFPSRRYLYRQTSFWGPYNARLLFRGHICFHVIAFLVLLYICAYAYRVFQRFKLIKPPPSNQIHQKGP